MRYKTVDRALFFFNNNATSSSRSSLLSEREEIIIDTQEIYLQDPLVYFDFDLKKKTVLLLHLLFIVSVVTVRYSQLPNILRLVQLLLSKSLLIALKNLKKSCTLSVSCCMSLPVSRLEIFLNLYFFMKVILQVVIFQLQLKLQ